VARGASNLGGLSFLFSFSPAKLSSQRTEKMSCTTCAKQLITPIAKTKSITPFKYIFDANTGQTLGAAIVTPRPLKPATINREIICLTGWENCELVFKLL
jgi:copper chaperone CopZ